MACILLKGRSPSSASFKLQEVLLRDSTLKLTPATEASLNYLLECSPAILGGGMGSRLLVGALHAALVK